MQVRTRNFILGFASGIGTLAVLPVALPALASVARPLVKTLIKHSLLEFDKLRTSAAKASESLEDLAAEIRSEVETELRERHAESDVAATASPSNGKPATSKVGS